VYIVDSNGKVVAKYFEEDYKDRVATADILARQFGAQPGEARTASEAAHLRITSAASNGIARPGLRITLALDVEMKPGMHVYAPGVQGYIPIDWRLDEGGPTAKRHPFDYPTAEMLHLKAIGETVPVYRGHLRLRREITFGQEPALKQLASIAGELIVKGSFRYQACDDRKCYLPENVPLEWHFHFVALDRQRVPAELQHREN
jgi:hypothetical protein